MCFKITFSTILLCCSTEPCSATWTQAYLRKYFPVCFRYSSLDNFRERSILNRKNITNLPSTEDDRCKGPITYRTADELGTLSVRTTHSTYSGGGFVADLGYNLETAGLVLEGLQYDKWIDRQTRALFVEFMLYEPTTNLFAFVRIIFEYLPSGAIEGTRMIEPLSVLGSTDELKSALIWFCQGLIVVFILLCLIRQTKKLFKEGKDYFRSPWNLLELFFIVTTVVSDVLLFIKTVKTVQTIKEVQSNPYAPISFDNIAFLTGIEDSFLAFVMFTISLKLLRIFRFNAQIAYLFKSLRSSGITLISYGVVFAIIMVAYASTGALLFGSSELNYSSMPNSVVNHLMMLLGGNMAHERLESISPVLTTPFLCSFAMTMTILMINVFVTILNDSFQDAKTTPKQEMQDIETGDFIADYVKSTLQDVANKLQKIGSKNNFKTQSPLYAKESDFFLY